MAEALLRFRFGGTYEAFSAGTDPTQVNPHAIRVMKELGVDLSGHKSEHLESYFGQPFDVVVTTCDTARETCPVFPGARRMIHHSFRDPAEAQGSEAEILSVFRGVRDDMDAWIRGTFDPRALGGSR
jgi:arsenate reductase